MTKKVDKENKSSKRKKAKNGEKKLAASKEEPSEAKETIIEKNESNDDDTPSKEENSMELSLVKTTTDKKDKSDDDEDDETEGIMTENSFASLGVCEVLCEAVEKMGWQVASKIQAQVLPHALQGKDVVGLAETGSGKTGAFCLPILQSLLEKPPPRGAVFAVMLAPTRELAFQIHEVVEALSQRMGATSVCVVGGVDMVTQAIALARNPHVVVATPGRLVDHLTHTKGFHLRKLRCLVMDEADRMLSLDFEQELNQILDVIPEERQTMLFSATMTSKVQKLQRASLSNPVRVEVSTKFQTPKKLLQSYMFIPAKYKDCYLTYLVNEHAGQSMLVFGATCNNVQRLALMLRNLGFPAISLHGQMSQPKRLGALHKFKSGSRDILICTDVASRGLDIPSVDLVINYDLPGHGKDYIHRVGRTARAGRPGKAIAMVTQYDVEVYQRLEALLQKKLPEYKLDEETVLVLLERVNEAQRLATRELKEQLANSSKGRKGKRRNQGDNGIQAEIEQELKGRYAGGSGGKGGALPNQRGAHNKRAKKHHPRR